MIDPTPERARLDVEAVLETFYARQLAAAAGLDPSYGQLWETMRLVHRAGGKRWRPYLMLVTYKSLGGEDYEAALPVAAALELMHAAMLMHDDIIDRDYTRHGQLNVAGHYRQRYAGHHRHRPEHYAASTALLAGDLALAGAYDLILSAPLPAHVRAHAGGIMSQTVFTLVGGEFLDTEAVLRPLEAPDSLKIALLKTASYSFEAPLRLGALLARAGAAELAALVQYGRQLGVAFQLADDLLGLFGDESATGKPTDSDLAEGKITYLIQRAVALAPPSERVELTALLGDPSLTSAQLDRARQIVAGCGARQETEQLIEGYAADAERALAGARLTPVARQAFTDMITRSIHRSK